MQYTCTRLIKYSTVSASNVAKLVLLSARLSTARVRLCVFVLMVTTVIYSCWLCIF